MLQQFRFILFVFLIFPLIAFAQVPGDDLPNIDIGEIFGTLAGLVGGVVLLTGLWKKFISDKNTFVVSIILSTVVCAAGFLLKLGIFIGVEWYVALIYDIAVILIIKGTVSIELIIQLLGLIGIGPKQPE